MKLDQLEDVNASIQSKTWTKEQKEELNEIIRKQKQKRQTRAKSKTVVL